MVMKDVFYFIKLYNLILYLNEYNIIRTITPDEDQTRDLGITLD
jgi:hypothetical protein